MPAALQRLHLKGSRPVWAFFNILSMLFVRLAEWSHCKEGRVCPCLPAALQKVDPRRAVVRLTGPYSVVHCAAMHPTQQLEMSQCCWLAQCGGPHRRGCLGDPHAQRGACSTLDANEAQRFPCASGHGHAINCEKSKESLGVVYMRRNALRHSDVETKTDKGYQRKNRTEICETLEYF